MTERLELLPGTRPPSALLWDPGPHSLTLPYEPQCLQEPPREPLQDPVLCRWTLSLQRQSLSSVHGCLSHLGAAQTKDPAITKS